MAKKITKSISKRVSSKYSQKPTDDAKQSETDALKTAAKNQFKKQQKQLVIFKSFTTEKLRDISEKVKHKYRKKYIRIQRKDSKLWLSKINKITK